MIQSHSESVRAGQSGPLISKPLEKKSHGGVFPPSQTVLFEASCRPLLGHNNATLGSGEATHGRAGGFRFGRKADFRNHMNLLSPSRKTPIGALCGTLSGLRGFHWGDTTWPGRTLPPGKAQSTQRGFPAGDGPRGGTPLENNPKGGNKPLVRAI